MKFLLLSATWGWLVWETSAARAGDPATPAATRLQDTRLAPYSSDPDHLWNRLHRALFLRVAPDGSQHIHSTDPLLYRYGTFLLEGEPHSRAIVLLDEFLARPDGGGAIDNPLKRLFLQRDLWAAFDYAAWYPDEWVHHSRHEPAAIALRARLARAVGRLAPSDREIVSLADNYALTVKSNEYPADYDPEHPERPFLPADLFDPAGPWVRFHHAAAAPMAQQHFKEAGGRAVHIIFLRLPGQRATTERYLMELCREESPGKETGRDSIWQFPPGTMVAMVRRALAVDRSPKVRVTPVTELVQIRVYRRIPDNSEANRGADFGEQDVYELVLDREKLFAGEHGLRAVAPDDPAEPFERDGHDPSPTDRQPTDPA
ncbi:MAG TPA: hypothetical protein VGX78_02025, partial [Pirellulales bacterium]|nr:hypothetical protein [Pirellulales bacterium]